MKRLSLQKGGASDAVILLEQLNGVSSDNFLLRGISFTRFISAPPYAFALNSRDVNINFEVQGTDSEDEWDTDDFFDFLETC